MAEKNTRKNEKKKLKPKILSKRRTIYFSGKLLNSKDLKKDQDYFINEQNQEKKSKEKPLYVVELPNISSKYIGETEKNLIRILQKTKNMNGIILFDEADSLFGKRSKVKDSHDRYANIETNYLLKKIQNYKGSMFITSNFKKPTKKHYVKKLDFIICFPIKKQNRK